MDNVTVFAPCRIGFAGGGTDLPAYADRFGGAVLSAAISAGATVTARRRTDSAVAVFLEDYGVEGVYASVEDMLTDSRPEVALTAAVIAAVMPAGVVDVRVRTGVPPGSGLGTSGAVGVAAAYALSRLGGRTPDPRETAEIASRVEIGVLGRPIGRQDQYAAAYGGVNLFRFSAAGVQRRAFDFDPAIKADFESYFMLFFSGRRRDSATVLSGQRERIVAEDAATLAAMHHMRDVALAMADALEVAAWPAFGSLMREAWEAKVIAAPATADAAAAALFRNAAGLGAWAMKVTGAGAGGFYLVMTPPARQPAVAAYLTSEGLQPYPLAFDAAGVRELP